MSNSQLLITTDTWIQDHGLKSKRLTRDQVLKKIGFKAAAGYVGPLKKNVKSRYSIDLYDTTKDSEGNNVNLTGRVRELVQEESELRTLIGSLQDRIDWLNSDSREKFGVVTEQNVLIIIDSYETSNVTFGNFCSAVAGVLREQIIEIQSFNVIRVNEAVHECWGGLKSVTKDSLRQSLAFVLSQQPSLGSDRTSLNNALPSMLKVDGVDGIYLLMQGSPSGITLQYLTRLAKESTVPINTCLYGPVDSTSATQLTEIAANSGGRWHHYKQNSSQNKDSIKLIAELDQARDVLAEVSALRLELQHKSGSKLETLPPATKSERDMNSTEWLKLHGLKSASARFYDALSSQAFRHCDKILKGEDGDKVVNAKYCQRFAHVKWWNGSVKHVIINQNFFEKYKSKMESIISTIEKRIDWVERSSKCMFGTLLEDNVCILLDTSESMDPHLPQLKKRLEKLITEQLKHKDKFTLAAFGSTVRSFSDTLIRVTPENLQAAWRWCSAIQCAGSTSTLEALKFSLSLQDVQGVYLLSDGCPDMPEERILNQIKLYNDVPIHTISFNCHDFAANQFLATLAQETAARYHVVRTPGASSEYTGPEPYESNDIKLLRLEIESGLLDMRKMTEVRSECEILEWKSVKKPPTAVKEKSRKRRNVRKAADMSDTDSVLSDTGMFSARKWLKKYGLVAQKLTIMDALAPTVITQHPKYVDALKKKVHAKVFDGVMPFAFLSPEDPDRISFVNPAAVNLDSYESKVKGAVALYDKKIAGVVWKKLDEEEKKKFHVDEDDIPGFKENEELFRSVLEREEWPVSQKTVKLISDEIDLGELYLTQSQQLRDQMRKTPPKEKSKEKLERKESAASVKSDNYMLGYRVVAQNSVDGFYYPGTVIGSRGHTQCEIEFDDFDRQIVFMNNLIPTQGSTARPKIKEGDYVLVQLMVNKGEGDLKRKLLAPGLVVKAPEHGGDVTYIILLFTGERLIASRHDVIKITKNRYTNSSQAIYQQLSRRRSSQCLRLVAEGQEPGDDVSVAGSLDEILKSNLLLNKPMSVIGEERKLDDMLQSPRMLEVTSLPDEDDTNDSDDELPPDATVSDVAEEESAPKMAKVTLECGSQVGGYDADSQTHISNDFWEDLDKVKYDNEEMVHESEILVGGEMIPVVVPQIRIPVLKVSATTPIQTDVLSIPDYTARSLILEDKDSVLVNGKEDSTLSSASSEGFFGSSDDEPTTSSKKKNVKRKEISGDMKKKVSEESQSEEIPEGNIVLARWADEGWYFRGKVVEKNKKGYVVQDNGGHREEINLKHILSDDKDSKRMLSAGTHVVGLHPDYSFSYAPALIIKTHDDWYFSLKFYDQTEAEVPREELYYISPDQYLEDTKFIRQIEDSMLGSFAVVRDDSDGLYRRGLVTQATGRSFGVSLNGETVVQDPSRVFSDSKKNLNQTLAPGSYCLCPVDDLQNSFGPATITEIIEDGALKVKFYDGIVLDLVEKDTVYPINKDFYSSAVRYISSKARNTSDDNIQSVV